MINLVLLVTVIWLSFSIEANKEFITFDSGIYEQFSYAIDYNFVCLNGASYTGSITFKDTFANVPKFIVTPQIYDTSPSIDFNLVISEITNATVTFIMTCQQGNYNRVGQYRFNWIAIDDNRIEVINDGSQQNVTGISNKIFTFPHSNKNFTKGFVSLTGFGLQGEITFSLSILTINQTAVSVNFTTQNQNLLSVGFQVILGTDEALDVLPPQIQEIFYGYESPNIPIPANYLLIQPIQGFSYDNVNNIRVYLNKIENRTIGSYACWDGSLLRSLTHQNVLINVVKKYDPFVLQKMTVITDYSFDVVQNFWKLEIKELNQVFKVPTLQTYVLNKTVTTLTLTYMFQSYSNQYIQGSVLKCLTCSNQYQSFKQDNINNIKLRVIFEQKVQINQELKLNLTETGFTITEEVAGQIRPHQYTIITMMIFTQ